MRLLLIILFLPLVSLGQFTGSKHDFGSTNKCQVCHDKLIRQGQQSYVLYSSPSLHAYIMQPQEGSKECLYCHNGSCLTCPPLSQPATIGMSLQKHHPVSFEFDQSLAMRDGGLHSPSSNRISYLLKDGRVECVSCHDPHGSDYPHMLKMSNRGSALCLTCHNK